MKIRKLIIVSPLGLVLLAGLAVAWWYLGDDVWIKNKIEDSVSELAGRSLSIDGDFYVDWSASPVVTAENIHLSNPSWALNPDLARLERLELSIDLLSLFLKPIKINYIKLDGLIIALEEDVPGEKSWEILPPQEQATVNDQASSEEFPVSIGPVTVTGFTLLHEAPDRTVPLDFHLEKLELDERADQQIQVLTEGRLGGERFYVKGDLGPFEELVAGGSTRHDIHMGIGDIILQSQGSIEELSTFSGANISLVFTGPEVEWILGQLALPEFSHGDFDFELKLQTKGGLTYLDLDGDLGSLQAYAKGDFESLVSVGQTDLRADVSGEDLGGLLKVFGVPGIPGEPFSLKLDINHSEEVFLLNTVHLETGGDKVSVSGQLGDWPELANTELDVSASGSDLNHWGEALHVDFLPETDFEFNSRISRTGSQPASTQTVLRLGNSRLEINGLLGKLPIMSGADLSVGVEGPVDGAVFQMLDLSGIPGKNFDLVMRLERDDSYIYLNEVKLDIEDNHLELNGQVGNWPELEGTHLSVLLIGPNLSAWSPALGMGDLPEGAYSLTGGISATAVGLRLGDMKLKLGSSDITVNGQLGKLPGFSGTDLSIKATGTSLAEFQFLPWLQQAPALPFQIDGNIGTDENTLTFSDLKLNLGSNQLHLEGQLGLNDELVGSELQAEMTLPSIATLGPMLGVDELPDQGLSVKASLQRNADAWLFQLVEGSFADIRFESNGNYRDINGQAQVEATSHVIAPDLAKLADLTGIENLPGLPIDIKGYARYGAGLVEIQGLEGTLGESQFSLNAKLLNPPTFSGSEVKLSASGPDLGQLLVNRDFDGPLSFSIDGKIARDEQSLHVNQLNARLGSLQANIDGIIGNLDDLTGNDLRIDASADSLKNTGELLGFPLPDEPFSLTTRIQGSTTDFQTDDLEVKLGSSDLTAKFSVNLEGKPRIDGVVQSDNLNLAWLQDDAEEDGAGETPGQADEQEFLIPDSRIEYLYTELADSDMDITVGRLEMKTLSYRDIHVQSRIENGNLYLDTIELSGEGGGSLSGSLVFEREKGSDNTTMLLDMEGSNIRLGFGAAEGQDPDTLRESDIVASLRGSGVTYHDLAGSLNGRVEVVQGPGLTENAGLGLFFGDFLGELLEMLNPFSKTEKFTKNECAVIVVNVESGLVTVDPFVSNTDKMTIVSDGVIDLNTENIQFTFHTKMRKGLGISASMVVNPFVGITGTLLSPVIGLDPAAVAVKGTVAVATLGISLLARSLSDRFLSSKDPCGDALKTSREQLEQSEKKEKKKK